MYDPLEVAAGGGTHLPTEEARRQIPSGMAGGRTSEQ